MGIGNHEEAWIQYNHGDPVARLIEKLNGVKGARIKHGSFWGYINTRFQVGRETAIHKLLYYHGTGGDSPVTKGTIDFNRKGRNWIYDALTFGHKHNIAITGEQIMDVTEAGRVVERLQLNLQTGSYYRNYRQIERTATRSTTTTPPARPTPRSPSAASSSSCGRLEGQRRARRPPGLRERHHPALAGRQARRSGRAACGREASPGRLNDEGPGRGLEAPSRPFPRAEGQAAWLVFSASPARTMRPQTRPWPSSVAFISNEAYRVSPSFMRCVPPFQ
jgi:hypothetical protein